MSSESSGDRQFTVKMSGDSDLPNFTVPPLKAYQRSNLRPITASHGDSPSKYSKKAKPSSPFSWLPGSPFAPSSSSSSSSSSLSRRTLCFLILLIAVTSLISLRYLGHLTTFLQAEDIGTSPTMISLSRHEAKQTEKLLELVAKVDEMRDVAARTIAALEAITDRAGSQQDQLRGLEEKLKASGFVAPGSSAAGVNVLAKASEATAAAVAGRVSEVAFGIRAQIEALGKQLNTSIARTAASLGRGRVLAEGKGEEDEGPGGDGASVTEAVSRLSSAVEVAAQQNSHSMRQLEDRINELAGRAGDRGSRAASGSAEGEGEEGRLGESGAGRGTTTASTSGSLGGDSAEENTVALKRIEEGIAKVAGSLEHMAGRGSEDSVPGSREGDSEEGGKASSGREGQLKLDLLQQQIGQLVEEVAKMRRPSGGVESGGEKGSSGAGEGTVPALEEYSRLQKLARMVVSEIKGGGREGGVRPEDSALSGDRRTKDSQQQQCGGLGKQVRTQSALVANLRLQLESLSAELGGDESDSPAVDEETSGAAGPESGRSAGISARALRRWRQGSFQKAGSYGFVSFSGYRASRNSFVSVGFGLTALHKSRSCTTCVWSSANKSLSLQGKARMVYPQNDHGLAYEALLLVCDFAAAVPAGGGHLSANIDHELVLLYKEEPEAYRAGLDPVAPFPSSVSVCAPPLSNPSLQPLLLQHWLEYHRLLGADRAVLYDAGGLGPDKRTVLRKAISSGTVDVVDFREIGRFEIWNSGEVVALHDCVHRLLYASAWVLYADMDDYLWLPRLPQTLNSTGSSGSVAQALRGSMRGMLQPYAESGGVTLGSLWFSVNKCRPRADHVREVLLPAAAAAAASQGSGTDSGAASGSAGQDATAWESGAELGQLESRTAETSMEREFAVERFVFHWPAPACFGNKEKGVMLDPHLCPGRRGHRRFFVNPRKVERIGTYGPLEADLKEVDFIHLVTNDAMFLHYDGVGTRLRIGDTVCNETVPLSTKPGWWITDPSFAQAFAGIRNHSPCNFSDDGCVDPSARPDHDTDLLVNS